MTSAIAFALGAIIGVLLGLLGGGGSILAVPALVYGIGLDIEQAIPVSLIVVGIAAAVGALPRGRARHVEWRLAAVFAAAGIPATFAGSALAGSLIAGHFGTKTNTERLQQWFAYLVFAVAAYVLVDTIFLT